MARPREARDEAASARPGEGRDRRARGGERLRSFFALALDGALRRHAEDALARLSRRPGADAVRWVRPEALHVTLRFLGEIDAAGVPALLAQVAAQTRDVPPFALRLGALSALPSPRRARVVTLEAGPEPALQQLAAAIERGVVAAGFEPETRRFRPHVTLGRVRRGARLARELREAMTVPDTPGSEAVDVSEAQLFRSDPGPRGSVYTSIGRIPLGGAGPESPLDT